MSESVTFGYVTKCITSISCRRPCFVK